MPSVADRMASDDTVRMMTSDDSDDRMAQVSRAAYLMVKGSIAEDLVTREECREEPTTQCRQVTRARPQKKCVPVDVQKCRWIVRAFKVYLSKNTLHDSLKIEISRRRFMRRFAVT